MKTFCRAPVLILALSAALAIPAHAGPSVEALSTCLGDHTSGKERKDLARWMFTAMATHPDIKDLSKATDAGRESSDKAMGQLVTALLAERCSAQVREVVSQEGSAGMFNAFRALGELAMKELMSNPDVGRAMGGYERYLDQAKIRAALGG